MEIEGQFIPYELLSKIVESVDMNSFCQFAGVNKSARQLKSGMVKIDSATANPRFSEVVQQSGIGRIHVEQLGVYSNSRIAENVTASRVYVLDSLINPSLDVIRVIGGADELFCELFDNLPVFPNITSVFSKMPLSKVTAVFPNATSVTIADRIIPADEIAEFSGDTLHLTSSVLPDQLVFNCNKLYLTASRSYTMLHEKPAGAEFVMMGGSSMYIALRYSLSTGESGEVTAPGLSYRFPTIRKALANPYSPPVSGETLATLTRVAEFCDNQTSNDVARVVSMFKLAESGSRGF